MIESLNAIRSPGLAPVFESLYLGEEPPADFAHALLGIADSGLGDEDMLEVAKVEERCERFITKCAP